MTSGPDQPFVRLQGVSKSYGAGPNQVHVLDGVDLELRSGETTSLIGRSGSGKSTLIGLIAGLMHPDAGYIRIGGLRTDTLDEAGRAGLRAERIGVVLQSDNLIPFLTAVENVELAIGFGSRRGRPGRARELLTELGLADRMDHLPRQGSGGVAQGGGVAVALATDRARGRADAVVGLLDSATAAQVTELVFAASRDRGLAVLYVTHDEQLARQAQYTLRLGDRHIVPA